ncbi:MAG: hypothetical protein HXY34_07210 [Candidatus Thorarchaeota archaeon]|nr:hypothetical protein [Candidatus Thorarchaeota archaeon]
MPRSFWMEDNRFPESLVRLFLAQFTEPGDIVLDPFAGFGTTLTVAEEMGRIPFGVERDPVRFEYVRSLLRSKGNMIHGDSRQLLSYSLPRVDFSMSSPPFMPSDYGLNPLTGEREPATYNMYLDALQDVYRQVAQLLRPDGTVVIEVSNLRDEVFTPFAWDVARAVSRVMDFLGETVVCWEGEDSESGTYGFGYDHSYCMVFRRHSQAGSLELSSHEPSVRDSDGPKANS